MCSDFQSHLNIRGIEKKQFVFSTYGVLNKPVLLFNDVEKLTMHLLLAVRLILIFGPGLEAILHHNY